MEVITASNFRTELYKKIKSALNGKPIRIKTKHGDVILVSEMDYNKRAETNASNLSPLSPKIPGKIVGNLENADKELIEYLQLPS